MLRFHTPLIEPDGRISRIRLSDKADVMPAPTRRCDDAPEVAAGRTGYAVRHSEPASFHRPSRPSSYATTDAAGCGHGYPPRDTHRPLFPDSSSWPSPP